MAASALLLLLGITALVGAPGRPAIRTAGVVLALAGCGVAVLGMGWGMGLTAAACMAMTTAAALALLLPLRPRLVRAGVPLVVLALAAAWAGGL
jgi:hypothetical protein